MFFDDRLTTVLRQRAQSDATKRTQFRQLLDLLGSQPGSVESTASDPSLMAAAWLRMDWLGEAIPAEDRARIVREPGWRFRNPELAAHLANFEPEVAAAALSRAQLSPEDWTALIPRLPVRARGFLRLRRDLPVDVETLLERLGVHDRGLPGPASAPDTRDEGPLDLTLSELAKEDEGTDAGRDQQPIAPPRAPAEDPASRGRSEISALVERIAQFKRSRESGGTGPISHADGDDGAAMPRLPLGEMPGERALAVRGFGFAADAAGRIEWADADVAAMVIGSRLIAPSRMGASGEETRLSRAFNRRQPLTHMPFELSGADTVAGEWIIDAQPRFTDTGNFAGYVGRFRRPPRRADDGLSAAQREADRIRQLLHELRTPVTAIQGYSEVIQQQLFGTAPHEYRALAAAIASDAARILSGFEELDRLARLETGMVTIEDGETDCAALVRKTANQLAQVLSARMAGIEVEASEDTAQSAAIEFETAEGLFWRLLATLGGGCAAGEMLHASFGDGDEEMVRFTCELPAQLLSEEDIFAAEAKPIGTAINPGLFGAGFALRLARAEARGAGGELVREDEAIILTLPRTGQRAGSSDNPESARDRR
jgi:signal transduction histidine kinase